MIPLEALRFLATFIQQWAENPSQGALGVPTIRDDNYKQLSKPEDDSETTWAVLMEHNQIHAPTVC